MDLPFSSFQLAPFVAGIVAGASGTIVGHPLDTLKTRFQVGKKLSTAAFNSHYIRQLYRGLIPPVCTSGAIQSVNFFWFETFRNKIANLLRKDAGEPEPDSKLRLWSTFLGGTISGSIVSILSTPISIVKIRQQVKGASSQSIAHCIEEISRTKGPRGFYRGYSTMLVLDASRGLYLTIYEYMKDRVSAFLFSYGAKDLEGSNSKVSISSSPNSELQTRIIAASVTGIVSWIIIYPIDVVRVRLHLDYDKRKYRNWIHCTQQIWGEGATELSRTTRSFSSMI
mmetsp:Transcript_25180/g.41956  ORF Transcript_25180/g.41956 Transcript_25180/m.41956 type:complete len:282 (-) Transcript_25180:1005-1850(-)